MQLETLAVQKGKGPNLIFLWKTCRASWLIKGRTDRYPSDCIKGKQIEMWLSFPFLHLHFLYLKLCCLLEALSVISVVLWAVLSSCYGNVFWEEQDKRDPDS